VNLDEFAQQIQDMRSCIVRLRQCVLESPPKPQELGIMGDFEQLSSNLEQLQQQHQQLFFHHHRVEAECQRYQDLFQFAPDAYLVTDLSGKIQEANQAAVKLLASKQQSLVGKLLTLYVVEEEQENFQNIFQELCKDSTEKEWEIRIQVSEKKLITVSAKVGIVCDLEGNIVNWRWLLRDISKQKRLVSELQESKERLQLAANAINGIIYDWNIETKFVERTQGLVNVLGFLPEEAEPKIQWWKNRIHPEDQERIKQEISAALRNSTHFTCEYQIKSKNNQYIYVSDRGIIIRNSLGKAVRVVGSTMNITLRKQAEIALRESEQRLQAILDNSLTAVYVKDLQGRYMMVNREAERILHRNRDEIIGKTDRDFLEPAIAETLQVNDQEVLLTQTAIKREEVVPQPDGLHTYIAVKFPLFDATGVPYAVCGISTDITERKAAEEALQKLNEQLEMRVHNRTAELAKANEQLLLEIAERNYVETALSEREQEFRALVENAPDIIARYDSQLRHIYINPAIELATGLSPREFIGKTLQELDIPTELASFWQQAIEIVFDTNSEHEIEFNFLTPSGFKYYQSRLAPELVADGTTETVLLIIRDITKLKQAEEEILKSEERFRTSVENMLDCFGIYTSIRDQSDKIVDFKTEYVNAAACANDRKTKEEIIGKGLCELLSAHIESGLFEEYCQVVETGEPLIKENLIYEDVYGQLRLTRAYDIRIAKLGDGFAANWRDITERKQSETALQESEQLLRQLAENIHEVFWMFTPDTSVLIYVSPAYEQIWGRSCESLYQDPMSWMTTIHPQDRDRVAAAYLKQSTENYDEDYRIVRPDGAIRWIRDRRFPVRDEQGRIYRLAGLAEDITSRKQAQEEIYKSLLKERELGELKSRFVSMTSHEFRTPLTTIQSSIELLEHYRHKLSQQKQITLMHRIQTAVERMTQMLDDILLIGEAESGKLEFNPTPLNLGKFCLDLVQELRLAYPNKQKITFSHQGECRLDLSSTNEAESNQLDYTPLLLDSLNQEEYHNSQNLVLMDEKLLRHILSNLLSNAIKYSPSDSTIQFRLICSTGNAIFQIQDQGIGIPPEDQERLFESFHRATNVGTIQGTGLGLTIVKQCVDLHQGKITVSSIINKGTTFTVTLPLGNW
jgi:PAS domain S-box-containing protein